MNEESLTKKQRQQMLAQQKKKVILQKNASKLFRKLVQQREFYAKDAMILDPLIEQVEKDCFEETHKEDIETAEELAERLYLLVCNFSFMICCSVATPCIGY